MYQWRNLTEVERVEILAARKRVGRPLHSPPHWRQDGPAHFHITAACFEHTSIIGLSIARMDAFAEGLLNTMANDATHLAAWCLLPNHYHLLIETMDLKAVTRALGRLHGHSSHAWNLEDAKPGRKVFHRSADRHLRSEAHYWATLNYVHHNPVRHGYVRRWTEWPWSSANDYLSFIGSENAARIWRAYPVLDYGEGWDDPHV